MIFNQWYAIMPSDKVKKGRIVSARRLNMDLVLFRAESGEISCVVDQCTHRGAALSKGKLVGDCIQCPFHGLQFDAQGKCRLIPANGISSKEDLSRYNVKNYPVQEQHGIIYIWNGDKESADRELPFFNDIIDSSFVYSEIEDHWASHYSRSIENQLDVVHLPFVHHNTIGRGQRTLVNGPKVEVKNNTITTSASNSFDNGQKPMKHDECSIGTTYVSFMFPNIWVNNISDDIKVFIYFAPVDDENTILYIRFYCKLSKLRFINKAIAFFGKFGNRLIERQDKRVVITQKPKASSLKSEEKLIPGDRPIIEYRRKREYLKKRNGGDD